MNEMSGLSSKLEFNSYLFYYRNLNQNYYLFCGGSAVWTLSNTVQVKLLMILYGKTGRENSLLEKFDLLRDDSPLVRSSYSYSILK